MISDISPVNNYSGNGSATTFDFDFYIEDSSQLKVYKINSSGATIQLSEDIDYSVNSFTDDFSNGGYITFPLSLSTHDILSTDEKISLQLDIPFEQESGFGNSSLLNLNSLEFSLDYLTRLCQILKRQVARCAKIREAIDVDPDSLSENINLLAEIKNDISTVSNAIDDVIVTSSNTENISSVAGNISNINAVKNNETNINAVNSNKTNIDTVAGSISDVNTVAGSIQDVNTVAGSIADINDIADDLTNINFVAGDLTNIDSVAGGLTNIDSVAGDLTNIDSVNSNKTNIDTVAGSIANVNSVAENIQDVNSVADNISNISAVKNNETNINAVNSNKTNIDTVAGSISNINTTAESIANVNTVAGSIQDINDVADDLTNINLVAGDLSNIDSASDYADNANVWAEGSDAEVQALGGVHSAKGWAEVSSSGQIQSDYTESDSTKKSYIKNKPDLTVYATQTDLTNGLATKQDTLIAGTDLEIIPAQVPILPEGFTQIEYIEGTGTQYIDTGFYGTQNSGVYIKFALTDLTSNGSAGVFGTRNGTAGTKAFAFISSYDGSSLPSDKFYIGSNGYASWPTNLDTNWHEVSCNIENDKKVYFDGNLIITGGNTAYTSTAQASIFRRYNQNTYSGISATAKISIVQIYENAVMVHNFIPCRRDSDDELGMYDLVSDTFFTNSGTGTFIAGPDVIFPETDLINFTNASGYTTNVGTVTSVNNIEPDENGNVTIQAGGATDVQINSTSVTNQGVANILTQTAYNATSNKIATMSDLPADKIFIATYGTTTFNEVWTAYDAGRTVFVKDDTTTTPASAFGGILAILNYFEFNSALDAHFEFASSILNDGTYYTYTLDQDSTWDKYTEQIPDTSGFANTDLSNLTATGKKVLDGQWTGKFASISSAASVNSYTHDLSAYLPNDNNSYEVYAIIEGSYNSASAEFALGTIANPVSNHFLGGGNFQLYQVVATNSRWGAVSGILPVGTSRTLYSQISGGSILNAHIYLYGYRRIGTNT